MLSKPNHSTAVLAASVLCAALFAAGSPAVAQEGAEESPTAAESSEEGGAAEEDREVEERESSDEDEEAEGSESEDAEGKEDAEQSDVGEPTSDVGERASDTEEEETAEVAEETEGGSEPVNAEEVSSEEDVTYTEIEEDWGDAVTMDGEPVEETATQDSEDPSYRVDTVLISAEELSRVGGAATRIDEEELQALEYDDPNSVLQQVPSVYVRREDGFGLRPNIGIRGANSERSKKVTLMEDGILFAPAPYSAPAAYYFPIASRMTGLEVYKGPSAVRFGPHTVGGAVNWITRPIPALEAAGLDLNFGSYRTGKSHGYYGKSWDHFGFLIEGVQWQSGGYKELDGGGDTGFNKSELMLKARVNSDFAATVYHALRVKLGYSRESSGETYLGLTDDDFAANPNRRYVASSLDRMNWNRTQGELRYLLEVGDEFDVTAVAYRNDFSRVWRKFNDFADPGVSATDVLGSPTGSRRVYYDILTGSADSSNVEEELLIGANDRTFVSQGVDLQSSFRIEGKNVENEVRFGARVHHDSIERLHTEENYRMQGGELLAAGGGESVTTENLGRTIAYSAFVLDQLRLWRLILTPGARVELIDGQLEDRRSGTTTSNFQIGVMPGLGAYYGITEDFGAIAGAHRGFSPVAPGQPDEVAPESSTNYEAGLRFSRPKSGTLLEAVGFFSDYGNLLGGCSFAAGCDEQDVDDQFNAGRVWVYGVETVVAHRFEVSKNLQFPTRAAYTHTQSQFRNGFASSNPQFGDVEAGDELPYVPEHQASLRLGVAWKGLGFNVAGTYVSPMREEAGQADVAVRTDPQYLVDLLASYEFFEGLSAYGKIDNVLGQRPIVSRRPFGARPARPLLAQLGLRWAL